MKKLILLLAFFTLTLNLLAQNDTVYATVSGDSVTIWHMNSFRNCGSLFDIQVDFDDHLITVNEVDTGQLAYCMCYFDLSVTLTSLEPGIYTVEVYGTDDGSIYFDRIYFEIGTSGFSYFMTDCLGNEKNDSSYIELNVENSFLYINWYNAELNCCPEFEWTTATVADTFMINLFDISPCDCICLYNLSIQYGPFDPGTYVLNFLDGLYGYPEFTIPETKEDPIVVSTYQSLCNDAQNVDDVNLLISEILIYPNPFENSFTIDYKVEKAEIVTIEIFDVLGNLVEVVLSEYKMTGIYSKNINSMQLKDGIYILKYSDNSSLIQKIIKQ